MAASRLTLLGLVAWLLAGCASSGPAPTPGVHEALARAEGRGALPALSTRQGFGWSPPYTPVVLPPDIRRVWVPTHVTDEGELVQGHWVFLRLTDWRWLIESAPGRGPLGVPVPGESPPPWPAPVAAGRQTLTPWGEGSPEGPAPPGGPRPEPPLSSGAPPGPPAEFGPLPEVAPEPRQ